MNNSKKYYLGLDIGTNSVGWAVVDENKQLVKHGGKTLWGVRMFEESQDAKARRQFRSARRRLDRKNQRIEWLNEIFAEQITKIDNLFFERLKKSYLVAEDRAGLECNLFNDISNRDFYKKYKTIYHLRKAIYEDNGQNKFDIRYIYLAIHHILKSRGHFLNDFEDFNKDDVDDLKTVLSKFNSIQNTLAEEFDDSVYFEQINEEIFLKSTLEIMCPNKKDVSSKEIIKMGKKEKKQKIQELSGITKKTFADEYLVPLIVSNVINFSNLKIVKNSKYDKADVDLYSEDLELKIIEGKGKIVELSEAFDFILDIKKITDHIFIKNLLGDEKNISSAFVNIYNDHKKDLKILKDYVKTCLGSEKYNECFRCKNKSLNNYVNYIKSLDGGKTKRIEFYSYLKKNIFENSLTDEKSNEVKEYCLNKIDNDCFLLKQRTNKNGSIPMQLHLDELKQIIANQKKYYPFLADEDAHGNNKITSIFKFKIPFYVGPLNSNSDKSWVLRDSGEINPWNFDDKIDHDKTSELFIKRMLNKCTYLKDEDDYALPRYSILYCEYTCLSYINKLKIDGKNIGVEEKKKLYSQVFELIENPKKKDIVNFFKVNYPLVSIKEEDLPDINCNMAPLIQIKRIIGEKFNIDLAETIIENITIFKEKKILSRRLKKYGLDNAQIIKLCNINYNAWGFLSKNLLDGIKTADKYGEIGKTVIQVMRETNLSLQEILYDDNYNLLKMIDAYNKKHVVIGDSLEDFIEENIFVTPKMIRPIVQSIKIIDELEKILGHKIDKYFVECTRTNKEEKGPAGQKKSRYNQILEFYKEIKKSELGINIGELEDELQKNKDIDFVRADKYFLYFMQLGRCMYSFEPIDINRLKDNYDIDHIYPQAIIKDDSLSNRVLVKRELNNIKQDKFIFEFKDLINPNAREFWNYLLKCGLINKEKYERLTEVEISKEKLDGFVNRQMVSTNQAISALIKILKMYKNVDTNGIVFSKAENVSDFRKKFNITKSREANNFHHAHDAYLNVIVGGLLDNYYKSNGLRNFGDYQRMKLEGLTINPKKLFEKDQIDNIWFKKKDIDLIKKNIFERFDILESTRTFVSTPLLSQVTIMPKGQGVVPQKKYMDIDKYGGFKQPSYAKFVIISVTKKDGGKEYKLVPIPRAYCNLGDSEDDKKKDLVKIKEYLSKYYSDFNVENSNIRINSIIKDGKKESYIAGVNGSCYVLRNAIDRFFYKENIEIIHKIEKYYDNEKKRQVMNVTADNNDIVLFTSETNNNKGILSRNELIKLVQEISNKFKKDIYGYSVITGLNTKVDEFLKSSINTIDIKTLLKVTYELLKLLKTNERKSADLQEIGAKKMSGILTYGMTLKQDVQIICKSITGYYTNVLFEVK